VKKTGRESWRRIFFEANQLTLHQAFILRDKKRARLGPSSFVELFFNVVLASSRLPPN
jgi:hypothetical protein